jgi:cytoskeleton protein RodZ
MDNGVGPTLRDARNRRKVELSEVESATKIRRRFLQAIENEEWDVLPGETYARSFIRTYANYLGLDGERLADQRRRGSGVTRPSERLPRADPVPARKPAKSAPRLPPRVLAAIVSLVLVAALVVLGLSGGGEDPSPSGQRSQGREGRPSAERVQAQAPKPGLSLRLTAQAEVWVCLLNASGKALVDGQILDGGVKVGPFRSGSFTVSLGNGEVAMKVNGEAADIPPTSSPVGYSIGSGGRLRELPEGERPSCT